jgi:hypothetical protein
MYVLDRVPMGASLDPIMEIFNLPQKNLDGEGFSASPVAHHRMPARLGVDSSLVKAIARAFR